MLGPIPSEVNAAGPRNASLAIADNASGSPQTVSLTATAISTLAPPGTYTLTVIATSGGDSHYVQITLNVQ